MRFSLETSALGKFCCGQSLTGAISLQICKVGQTVQEAQSLQGRCIDADPDAGIARLDPLESASGCEGSSRDDAHRQPTSLARVMNVGPEFAEGAADAG
jgi:hypothetical protein